VSSAETPEIYQERIPGVLLGISVLEGLEGQE
jgi:hypothetical protein